MFKILLIDDDEVDRKAIVKALNETSLKAKIVEVDTPEEGIELFSTRKFDCILLDYGLPKKNGLKVLQQLMETKWEGPPTIIVLGQEDDDQVAVQCLRAGAQDFFTKNNVSPDFLARSIANAIERKNIHDQRLSMESKLWENQKNEAVKKATNSVAREFETLWESLELALKPLGYENLSKAGAKSLNTSASLVERGTDLVKGLLDLSDEMETINKIEEANYLLNDSKLILQGVLGTYKTLEVNLIPRRRSIQVHKGLFKNAMINLVRNASEAMQAGGVCMIKLKEIIVLKGDEPPVKDMPEGKYIRFSISDNGAGMSKEILKKATNPKFTTKKGRNAQGSGLSQVTEFVKRSDGVMKIESTPGEGTVVRLYFPIYTP